MNEQIGWTQVIIFVASLLFLACFDKIKSIKDRVETLEKSNRELEKELYDIKWKRKE